VLGANDAVGQTPLAKWNSSLSDVLEHLGEHASVRAQIFVVGIVPIRSVPGFASRFGTYASEHAKSLNAATIQRCTEYERVAFVPLPAADANTEVRFGDGRTYRGWAAVIADVIAPTLHSARWPLAAWEENGEESTAAVTRDPIHPR
jgi:hypothetical protein